MNKIEFNKWNNVKIYKILSYIWFFWIVGIFCEEKDNPSLRFHVGQGIMLTICSFVLGIVSSFLVKTMVPIFGDIKGYFDISLFLINAVYIFIGVSNVMLKKDNVLPIIGKYAFFK